ncbi:MAG: RNA-binding S4 domain-containing protein [Lachnospiraceae bacterium]|nr:RNA-binding S4 domain-containing protein [Lachnospiraceae bacterium]
METVKIKDEYIKLGQLLKLAGIAGSGLEAKILINEGKVKVNNETVTQRGKKIIPGDTVSFKDVTVRVEN